MMKRNTGILVALLMFTLGTSKFVPEEECVFEQLMEPNMTYYIYSKEYPDYYYGERRCRFSGLLPEMSKRVLGFDAIKLSCPDIDIEAPSVAGLCGKNGITINMYKGAHKYSSEEKCGLEKFERVYITDRIDIDWSAFKSYGRFSCNITAQYELRPDTALVISPNKLDRNPPPAAEGMCGAENEAKPNEYETTRNVLNGDEVRINQYPFMAALVYSRMPKSKFFCGASIISERYALSSAQCVYNSERSGGKLKLRVGDHNNKIAKETNQSKTYAIEWTKQHEMWSLKDIHFNDIMLIKTRDIIKFGYGVGAVCLPYSAGNKIFTGLEVKTLGWSKAAGYGDVLREYKTTTLENCRKDSDDKILTQHQSKVLEHTICTSNMPFNNISDSSCYNHTGNPLIWKNKNKYYLVGILTLQGCVTLPSKDYFTRVTKYLDWIKLYTQDQ